MERECQQKVFGTNTIKKLLIILKDPYTLLSQSKCVYGNMLYARSSLRHYDLRGSRSNVVRINHVAKLFKFVTTYNLLTAKIPLPAIFPV